MEFPNDMPIYSEHPSITLDVQISKIDCENSNQRIDYVIRGKWIFECHPVEPSSQRWICKQHLYVSPPPPRPPHSSTQKREKNSPLMDTSSSSQIPAPLLCFWPLLLSPLRRSLCPVPETVSRLAARLWLMLANVIHFEWQGWAPRRLGCR